MTSYQRRCDVIIRRRSDVIMTSCACWEPNQSLCIIVRCNIFSDYLFSDVCFRFLNKKLCIIFTDYSPSGNYMVAYYCGHMSSNWWYEGSLVYSKTPTISQQDAIRVAAVIKDSMGRSLDQYCSPETSGCKDGNGSGRLF